MMGLAVLWVHLAWFFHDIEASFDEQPFEYLYARRDGVAILEPLYIPVENSTERNKTVYVKNDRPTLLDEAGVNSVHRRFNYRYDSNKFHLFIGDKSSHHNSKHYNLKKSAAQEHMEVKPSTELEMLRKQLRPNEAELCVEGESIFKGCDHCICMGGQLYVCTARNCGSGKRDLLTIPTPPECIEGEFIRSFDGCNRCYCGHGRILCTKSKCKSEKGKQLLIRECTPGQRIESTDDCNTCSCNTKGLIVCTTKACGPDLNITQLSNSKTSLGCVPDTWFSHDGNKNCKECYCINGKTAFCYMQLCRTPKMNLVHRHAPVQLSLPGSLPEKCDELDYMQDKCTSCVCKKNGVWSCKTRNLNCHVGDSGNDNGKGKVPDNTANNIHDKYGKPIEYDWNDRPKRPTPDRPGRPSRPDRPGRPGTNKRPTRPWRPDYEDNRDYSPEIYDRPSKHWRPEDTWNNSPDRPGRPDRPWTPDRPWRPDRPGNHWDYQPGRPSRPGRPGSTGRPGESVRPERPGRPDHNRPGKPDKPVRPERPGKPENNRPGKIDSEEFKNHKIPENGETENQGNLITPDMPVTSGTPLWSIDYGIPAPIKPSGGSTINKHLWDWWIKFNNQNKKPKIPNRPGESVLPETPGNHNIPKTPETPTESPEFDSHTRPKNDWISLESSRIPALADHESQIPGTHDSTWETKDPVSPGDSEHHVVPGRPEDHNKHVVPGEPEYSEEFDPIPFDPEDKPIVTELPAIPGGETYHDPEEMYGGLDSGKLHDANGNKNPNKIKVDDNFLIVKKGPPCLIGQSFTQGNKDSCQGCFCNIDKQWKCWSIKGPCRSWIPLKCTAGNMKKNHRAACSVCYCGADRKSFCATDETCAFSIKPRGLKCEIISCSKICIASKAKFGVCHENNCVCVT